MLSKKTAWDGPQRGRKVLFPANPHLADILGDTHLDFGNVFIDFFWIRSFKISRVQISKFPEIWPGPGLGWAWAGLGPGSGQAWGGLGRGGLGPGLGRAGLGLGWVWAGPGWARKPLG